MNNILEHEYQWINSELSKIISDKNQYVPEVITDKLNLAQTTIIDINEKLEMLKIGKFKKIIYSILKIFTFGKIDKNKIIKEKNIFFNKMKEKLAENIKKITEKLHIKKANINVNKINNTTLKVSLINSAKSNLPQM